MRNSFIESLVQAARSDERIILIVGDLGFSVVEPFADEFPQRFINAGVAEQNMIGLAAGMASENLQVFCYSIANFPTFRCAEQIRNDVCYHNLPVTIVAVGGGVAYGNLGFSHHATQDYSLMRTMPNMKIVAPADPLEAGRSVKYVTKNRGPTYIRLGKAGETEIEKACMSMTDGGIEKVLNGSSELAIISTGAIAQKLLLLTNELTRREITLYTCPVWSSESKNVFIKNLQGIKKLMILEDHLIDGGFGSWVLEANNSTGLSDLEVKLMGLNKLSYSNVAKEETLLHIGGISMENILKKINEFFS